MSQRRESQGKGEREEGTDGADKQGGGGGKDDHPRQKKTPGFAGAARFAKKRITGQPRSSSVVKEQDKKHFSPPLPAPSSPLTPPLGAAQPQPRLSWEPWRKISDSQQPIASASVATPPVVLKYQHDNIIVPPQEPLLPQETDDVELSLKLTRMELERDRYKRDIENKERQLKEYEEELITLRTQLSKSRGGGGIQLPVDQLVAVYEANIRQLEDEKSELANKVKELEYERYQLGKKNEEMELMENIELSEVRKEKDREIRDNERELAKARKAIEAEKQRADQEMRKNEELQEMLNEQEREKVEQLELQKETIGNLKEQLAQKEKGLITAQATVADLKEHLAQKGEGIAMAQAEQAQPPHVTENKALEELKEEHQRILKEQKEKKKHLKDKVKKLEQAETLRQSEAVDAGKREAELEKELNSLKGRIDSMKEGLRRERLKMKQLEDQRADEKAEQERSHQQEMMKEKAHVKALTDERAGLIMRHNQEMTRLKDQLTNAQTRAQESEKRLLDIKKDNDTLKTEKEVEMTHMRNTLEEKEKKLTRLLQEKEEELKRVQDERSQTVKQLRQQLEAAMKKADDNEKKINELEEMLVIKDLEISTYTQDFEIERKYQERINSKLIEAEEQKGILSNMLAEKEKELTEAKKDAKKWTKKNKELEQLETDWMKEMEEEIQVLTAQVNAYSRECEKQKGFVEKHKTEIQELNEKLTSEQKSNQKLVNELNTVAQKFNSMSASEKSNQQLVNDLTILRQQVDSLTASKESLLTAYNQEQAMVTSLEQQLQRMREESAMIKEESVRMKQSNKVLMEKVVASKTQEEEVASLRRILSEFQSSWKASRYDVNLSGKELGRGGWGVVWIGQMRVAVKQIHQSIKSDTNLELLRQEINTMSQIRHPNLVHFIGAVFDGDSPDMIITEVMDTSLRKAYESKELTPHPSCRPVILSIMRDVAVGLSYLHCLPDPIIHRDVSSGNVLLQSIGPGRWRAKISDFGSAKIAQFAVTKGPGAFAYSAPEAFQSITNPDAITRQTPKMDVFSYGVLLCEAITCRFPDRDAFQDMLRQVYRISDIPRGSRSTQGHLLHALILSSCNDDPSKRPTMNEVIKQLGIVDQKNF